MNLSIGGKIFGITLCLLALTALVSIISSGLVSRGRAQLLVVSEGFVPLKDAVSDFRFRMLERQMHLARARALLARTPYREEELARERALLGQKDAEAAAALEHAARAELLLESAPLGGRGKVEMAKFSVLLAGLQTRSRESSGYSTRLLDAMTVHDSQAIAALTPLVEKTYAETMSDSEKGLADVSEFNRLCTEEVLDMQQRIQRVSFTATGIACLVGLVLSILVIRGLMRSVRALMTGVHAVESGKLDVEVQVATADEIAELARSFNKMVQELRVKDRIKDTSGGRLSPQPSSTPAWPAWLRWRSSRHSRSSGLSCPN
ncbi:MAG: HAMP domain-containing protein [Candidatus Riflebacteria bacterium]|nr:HAMP domain-containing protein [Candidatus Riflebacteria bacterium]